MSKADAEDLLSLASLVHRRLDVADTRPETLAGTEATASSSPWPVATPTGLPFLDHPAFACQDGAPRVTRRPEEKAAWPRRRRRSPCISRTIGCLPISSTRSSCGSRSILQATVVEAALRMRRNGEGPAPLVLDGRAMELLSVALDGGVAGRGLFGRRRAPDHPGRAASLHADDNEQNSAGREHDPDGALRLQRIFCTQCEAQGFRRITYFPDRPDVMARYRVRIEADKAAARCCSRTATCWRTATSRAGGISSSGRTRSPSPPISSRWWRAISPASRTASSRGRGRKVALRIYAEQEAIGQCGHAMDSLKRSMQWDEDVYGLEYDLDLFQIVGVADFNFGAMENKGLNIFNTSAMLARSDTSTDVDFQHGRAGHRARIFP